VVSSLKVKEIKRVILMVLVTRKGSFNDIRLTVVALLCPVLQEGIHLHLNTEPSQNQAWGWCALGVVIHIVSRSVNGLASALFVDKTTRMWFLGRILMLSFNGSQ
jgi:hypothetical protein